MDTLLDFMFLAQFDGDNGAGGILFGQLINMVVLVVILAGLWQILVKMGEPGWKGIVPIYNVIVLLEKVDRPTWWVLLFFVPIANIVVGFLLWRDIAEGFGHGTGFAIGLLLLGIIFIPILGFGDSQWQGMRKKKKNFA